MSTDLECGTAAAPRRRRTIATVCLSGTLEDKLAAAASAGFDGVEMFENDLIATPCSPSRIRSHCADLGLSIDLYQPFRDFEAVGPDTLEANLRRAEHKLDVAEQLGARTLLVCSSVSPEAVDDDDLAAEQLHELARRADDRGARIAYEALAWGRFVNTYEHSWRIVRRADHPALGVCLDSFHILSQHFDPAGIRVIPGSKVFFLQLADAPRMDMDVLQWSRHYRLFPGQGSFDLTDFTRQVLHTGYDGPLSLEVFNDVFRQSDPQRAGIDAMRSLLFLEDTLSTPDPTRGQRVRTAPVASPTLPPAPELTGHSHTEVAVDDTSRRELAATLAALGFTHAGRHRSKPVHLWQQGDARVLLDASPHEALPPAGAAVNALGLDSLDPATSARRARQLLAPASPQDHPTERASPASISAPDGTGVSFSPADTASTTSGASDLTQLAPASEGIGLNRTDHVCLTQPFDHFDEAVLFYRSVLGSRPETPTEVAAPFGLVRSRAIVDPHQRVRIALNVATLRRGQQWAPRVAEPQHIAFSTDDALAAAKAARALGAPVLAIPDNYYDDLDARLRPGPKLLAELRAYSVLYDRDEDGEFLHFYTELLGSKVFFEVVQRIDGYAGFGASNAPIRMAAHRRLGRTRVHDR